MYEAYFHLKERPFSISPDPRFFYLTAQHKEALTNCQYMITNRVGPVYVHGDVGTGKTTIARRLYQQLLDDPTYQHFGHFLSERAEQTKPRTG
jgi:general secretion pathway protein A